METPLTEHQQLQKFISFLEERPACNRKCKVTANVASLRHEVCYATYLEPATRGLLAIVYLGGNRDKSLDELISILKEVTCTHKN